MNTITNSAEGQCEAQAWLAGQLRWERVLDQLRGTDPRPATLTESLPEHAERPAA